MEIPKGWRQVDAFEDVLQGDQYYNNGRWMSVEHAVGLKAVEFPYYVIIRFKGIGSGYFGTRKKYRSIDDV